MSGVGVPFRLPAHLGDSCWDHNHFESVNGALQPQPWMQYRHVATTEAASRAAAYAVTGGFNKNDLLHSLLLSWTNDSPINQWVYGIITRGGQRVTLQARSRGYLRVVSGYAIGTDPGPLTICGHHGTGADTGVAGILAIGQQYTIIENRANTVSFPLAPERPNWQLVTPGQTFTGMVQVSFVSEQWEISTIDGGSTSSESSYETGDTRLDLFAIPAL